MSNQPMNIVILGLTMTSSWGNGHATTYRGLVRELAGRGHRVLFLERDAPWYASTRDLKALPDVRIEIYRNQRDLRERFTDEISRADAVIVGSYVPQGAEIGEWVLSVATGVTAFYDIDTPITLAKLERDETDYISRELIAKYQIYLSFTGGPVLERLEREFQSPMARPLYCSFDPEVYFPEDVEKKWDLGFLGTYSADRQAALQRLLVEPAAQWPGGRFVVAGSQYPPGLRWPTNVERIEHLPPDGHRKFYNEQIFTLNITRAEMIEAGYSPSVRLFEAAACGIPVICDEWEGLDSFFEPGEELMVARDASDVMRFVTNISRAEAREIGEAARRRALAQHTAAHRADELENYLLQLAGRSTGQGTPAHHS